MADALERAEALIRIEPTGECDERWIYLGELLVGREQWGHDALAFAVELREILAAALEAYAAEREAAARAQAWREAAAVARRCSPASPSAAWYGALESVALECEQRAATGGA